MEFGERIEGLLSFLGEPDRLFSAAGMEIRLIFCLRGIGTWCFELRGMRNSTVDGARFPNPGCLGEKKFSA